jgi:ABC-type lipoprotein export system ATPase subunit
VTHDLNVANLAERQIEVLDGKINWFKKFIDDYNL